MRAHGRMLPCPLPLLADSGAPHHDDDGADAAGSWPAAAGHIKRKIRIQRRKSPAKPHRHLNGQPYHIR